MERTRIQTRTLELTCKRKKPERQGTRWASHVPEYIREIGMSWREFELKWWQGRGDWGLLISVRLSFYLSICVRMFLLIAKLRRRHRFVNQPEEITLLVKPDKLGKTAVKRGER
jgi:hypothetical protein